MIVLDKIVCFKEFGIVKNKDVKRYGGLEKFKKIAKKNGYNKPLFETIVLPEKHGYSQRSLSVNDTFCYLKKQGLLKELGVV
jgi:hypothetical protein